MRRTEPKKLASESQHSAKRMENAKPQRVGMKASAYVVPGAEQELCGWVVLPCLPIIASASSVAT